MIQRRPVPGHVLETLLGPDVVIRVEAVELAHEQLVRHAVARRPEVTQGRWVGPELQERPAGDLGQLGRVAMLRSKILGHRPLF